MTWASEDRVPTLDLFSGIGGLSLALAPYARPVAYCEIDPYCRAVLSERMAEGLLDEAPILEDVRNLRGCDLAERPDLIVAGFPCQDLSVAGHGAGLAGERSGLFFEVVRLAKEIRPAFVFLENVPAIRLRGADKVVCELATLGYDARWSLLSAYDVGAPHKRERWFLLAHRHGDGRQGEPARDGAYEQVGLESWNDAHGLRDHVPHTQGEPLRELQQRMPRRWPRAVCKQGQAVVVDHDGWSVEPDVGRVAHGVPARMDRLRALGNAVVPAQAREAFERLSGVRP